jgi:hypothetical protein
VLDTALGFDAHELDLNRQGELSERQRARIASEHKQSSVATLIAGVLTVLTLAGIGGYALLLTPSGAALLRGPQRNVVLPVLGVGVLLPLISLFARARRNRRLAAGVISVVEGPVTLTLVRMVAAGALDIARAGTIRVRGTTFRVPEAVLMAFREGAHYRFHYVAHAPVHLILSVEALSAAQ